MQGALRGERTADVPCDGCTACCTSSQFIHIGPDEVETLARIPAELQFAAPGLPAGNVVLGYDDNGHCPMLIDGLCSIYDDRPRTCRTYDCRVFPAAGVAIDDESHVEIARRARRWRFDFPTDDDEVRHGAVRAAATFVRERADLLGVDAPANATQRAVLAIRLHDAFLAHDDETDCTVAIDPDPEAIRTILRGRDV
jgi:Fe-S-cluster containining protein